MSIKNKYYLLAGIFSLSLLAPKANAMTLDWSGYLRADHDYLQNYQLDKAAPGNSTSTNGGETINGQGQKSTAFSSVFMKLKPKVLVNDNVIIHSEWNIGDPVYGFFGRNTPDSDRNNPFSTSKDSMSISAARLWLDTHTDFGTLQIGRAPMQWGIGAIFNAGDLPFDRYQSTSDTIRLVSKFGYLTFMPLFAKNSMGSHLAGASDPIHDTVVGGSDDVTDYGLALKYDNPEEDVEGGVLFYKRNASDTQNTYYFPGAQSTYLSGANGMNLKLVDLYAKKTWTHLELKGELPFYSGEIGDVNNAGQRNVYKVAALVAEASLNYDSWKHSLKFGTVPGQGPETTGAHDNNFGAMNLNRDYKLGLIMFNYNLRNFGKVNPDTVPNGSNSTITPTTVSPYDMSISDAKYLMWASEKRWEQWSFNAGLVFAKANHAAQAGTDFYSPTKHSYSTSVATQGKNLGWELDLGTHYNWDDNVSFGLEGGLYVPGSYFAFNNTVGSSIDTSAVKAFSLTATTSF